MDEMWWFLGGTFAGGFSVWIAWTYSDWKHGVGNLRKKIKR